LNQTIEAKDKRIKELSDENLELKN